METISRTGAQVLELERVTVESDSLNHVEYRCDTFVDVMRAKRSYFRHPKRKDTLLYTEIIEMIRLLDYPRPLAQYPYFRDKTSVVYGLQCELSPHMGDLDWLAIKGILRDFWKHIYSTENIATSSPVELLRVLIVALAKHRVFSATEVSFHNHTKFQTSFYLQGKVSLHVQTFDDVLFPRPDIGKIGQSHFI